MRPLYPAANFYCGKFLLANLCARVENFRRKQLYFREKAAAAPAVQYCNGVFVF
jgi:hypothetical protein